MRFLLKNSYPNEKYSETSPPTSPNSSNVKDTAVSSVLRCTFLNIFSKSQINQVKDVNQKVTLHRANSIAKAMDDLFKHNGNRA